MRPLYRKTGPCRIDGAKCIWCGQLILPDEDMTTLKEQNFTVYWHAECEQMSITCPEVEVGQRALPRPAQPLHKLHSGRRTEDRANIVIGLAFGVAFALFLAVLGHGIWKFFSS